MNLLILNKKQITENSSVVFFKKKEKNNILKQNKIKTALSSKARSVQVSSIVTDPSFQYILRSKDIDRKWSAWRHNDRKPSSEGFTDNM